MPAADIQAVLCDLDGTLVDSVPDLTLAINAVLAELNQRPQTEQTIRDWVGNGAERLLERAVTGTLDGHLPTAALTRIKPRFLHYYRQYLCVRSRLYPGVAETLAALSDVGIGLACVTNKPSAFVQPLLEQLGIAAYFRAVIGADDAPRKPAPEPLWFAAGRLGVPIQQCLMVGDSGNDVSAARAAGCRVIAVSYGYNHGHDIHAEGADAVIDVFSDLPAQLGEVPA